MALDGTAPPSRPHDDHATRPLAASLRWALGWTVLVAGLGSAAGCATGATVDAPAGVDGTSIHPTSIHPTSVPTTSVDSTPEDYASCVIDLGGSPDAIEHHIDACEVARRLERKAR